MALRSASIERFVAPLVSGGLDAHAAEQIFAHRRMTSEELAFVSEQFARHFTAAGARAWKKLTGIAVASGQVSYPRGFLPVQSLLQLRTTIAQGAVDETAVAAPKLALDWQHAVQLCLPERTLEVRLAAGGSRVVAELVSELQRLEATNGDHDGFLAPRDLANASAGVRAVMEQVYRAAGGHKKLALADIEARAPQALVDVFRSPVRRKDLQLAALYTGVVGETLDWLAAEYHRQVVVAADKTVGDFLDSVGVSYAQARGRLRRLAPEIFAKPTDQELVALWRSCCAGRITDEAFFDIGQLSATELRALQKRRPVLFPAAPVRGGPPTGALAPADPEFDAGIRLARAQAVAAAIIAYRRTDILATQADIVCGLNSDKALVARWGAWSENRLIGVRNEFPALFPRLRRGRDWLPVLTREVEALVRQRSGMTHAQVIAALKPRYPRIGRHHLLAVSESLPALFSRQRAGLSRAEQAYIVATKVRAYLEEDVLLSRDDLVRRLNDDPDFVTRFGGAITVNRYNKLATGFPESFPDLGARDRWLPVLRREIAAILEAEPTLTRKDVLRRLRQRHPALGEARMAIIAGELPGLLPSAHATHARRPNREVAHKIAELLKRRPTIRDAEIVELLRPAYAWLTEARIGALARRFPGLRAVRAQPTHGRREPERETRCMRDLFALVLRMVPPGTSIETVVTIYNRELERRGLKPFDSFGKQANRESHTVTYATTVSRILAEYTQAAPRSTTADDILRHVHADYPSISFAAMKTYRALWDANPSEFPWLGAFFAGRAGGKPPPNARYIGGWQVERAVLGAEGEERAEWARLTQAARIPLRLPMLDAALTDLGSSRPFKDKNVLMVSHLLATAVPLTLALRQAGLFSPRAVFVGSPYGSNRSVRETLVHDGWDVRVPPLSVEEYRRAVEQGLDDIAALHRKNGHPIIVLDDGGFVSTLLHEKERYADILDAVRLVEQTTGGVILAEAHALKVPVINVARCMSKAREAPFIGASVAMKIRQALDRVGQEVRGKKVVVIGYGFVGTAVARALRGAGADVTVQETSDARRAAALDDGFAVTSDLDVRRADVVVGCTGKRTLELQHMRQLTSGAVIASASSKRTEFDMGALEEAASAAARIDSDVPLLTLPNVKYTLGRRHITVIGDGWPINFDGDVEDIAPEDIQLTRAVMFSAGLQACKLRAGQGLVPFDVAEDEKLLRRFKELRGQPTGAHPLRDPAGWDRVVRDLWRDTQDLIAPASNERLVQANAVGKAVALYLDMDPFLLPGDVVALLNDDAQLVERWGRWDVQRLTRLRAASPDQIPNFDDPEQWQPALARELAKAPPGLGPDEVLRALRRKYPRVGPRHVRAVSEGRSELSLRGVRQPHVTAEENAERAQQIGAAAHRIMAGDYLMRRSDIIARLAEDRDLTGKWGRIDVHRYAYLQHQFPQFFPELKSKARWLPLLRDEIQALRAGDARIHQSEALRRLKARHPRISHNHIDEAVRAYPDLFLD